MVQYRAAGRSRRFTIGLHGIWTPEEARREAKVLLGAVARGGNPAEERRLDREAITVKDLCTRYLEDLKNGLVLGKRGRPKKPTTISTDVGRIERHIVPLLGNRRVRDLVKSDITQAMKDIMAGKTRANVKDGQAAGGRSCAVEPAPRHDHRSLLAFSRMRWNSASSSRTPCMAFESRRDKSTPAVSAEQEYRTLGEIPRRRSRTETETTAEIYPGDCPDRPPAQQSLVCVAEK